MTEKRGFQMQPKPSCKWKDSQTDDGATSHGPSAHTTQSQGAQIVVYQLILSLLWLLNIIFAKVSDLCGKDGS